MKRMLKTLLIGLCALLLLAAPLTASAAGNEYVFDLAGILSESQCAQLEQTAREISQEYQCGMYIVVVEDYSQYGSTPLSAAKEIYRQNGFGLGSQQNGSLLFLSMDDRDYALIAYGEFGNKAFTDYGKDKLEEAFLEEFAENKWQSGFRAYLEGGRKYLSMASKGFPYDVKTAPESLLKRAGVCLVLSCGIAAIVCLIMKSKMKSVRKGANASAYVVAGSEQLMVCEDIFTHVTETRRRIERSSSSGGHGGGTSIGGDGFSGHSGKF